MPPWQFIQGVQGVNVANAIVATAKISKTGGVDATFDAGAASNEKITGDGFVEFTGCIQNSYRILGFSVDNPGVGRDEIDYGIYLRADGFGVTFYENGAGLAHTNAAYGAADVFRLERVGATVRAYINGEHKFTFPTASAGSLLIDTSFFNTGGTFIGGIKLYDGTSKSWRALTWVSTNCTIVVDASATTRRITLTAPTKMRAGDQLVAIFASQGTEFVSASSVTWDFTDALVSATNKRGCAIYRRTVTASEPASYTFDLNVTQETLGALIVYRGLDNGAPIVGASAVDFAAATVFPCPSRTLTRYSDLYLGVVLTTPVAGGISFPPGWNALGAFFTQSVLGVISMRLAVFDIALEAVGATDTERATDGTPQSGMAASVALQGLPAIGAGLSFAPIVPGAIGLPVEGV